MTAPDVAARDQLWSELGERISSADPEQSERLFHGRGAGVADFDFFAVDLFHPILLITVWEARDAAWWEDLRERTAPIANEHGLAVLAQRRDERDAPWELLHGELPDRALAHRDGHVYELNFGRAKNPGFFLDMAAGHRWLREGADGQRVLNLFAYTCAFSVEALAGGASEVLNIDMSRRAIGIGKRNHALNALPNGAARVRFLPHDIFKSWGKLKRLGPWDRIVVDPPAYQYGAFVTDNDYPRILQRLDALLAPGGQVLLCLNHPGRSEAFLRELVEVHTPWLRLAERLPPAPGFDDVDPDRALKLLVGYDGREATPPATR